MKQGRALSVSVSMQRLSVDVFAHYLGSLSDLLDDAAAYAESRKVDASILLNSRLYPDMFNLARQVGEANRHAAIACGLLAGVELPDFPDIEPGIPELKARIATVVSFLRSLQPATINDAAEKQVVFKFRNGSERRFTG